jgi:ribonuclease HI
LVPNEVWSTLQHILSYLSHGTNNTAELRAAELMFRHISTALVNDLTLPRLPLYAFTDSKYAIGVVDGGSTPRTNVKQVRSTVLALKRLRQLIPVVLDWVPAHAGIELNEIADQLAERGRKGETSEALLQAKPPQELKITPYQDRDPELSVMADAELADLMSPEEGSDAEEAWTDPRSLTRPSPPVQSHSAQDIKERKQRSSSPPPPQIRKSTRKRNIVHTYRMRGDDTVDYSSVRPRTQKKRKLNEGKAKRAIDQEERRPPPPPKKPKRKQAEQANAGQFKRARRGLGRLGYYIPIGTPMIPATDDPNQLETSQSSSDEGQ